MVLVFSILITWAAHLSLCDFINFIISIVTTLKHENKIEVLFHRLTLEGNKTLKFTKILTKLVNRIK